VSFRGRLAVAFVVVVLIPLGVLAIGVRNEMRVKVVGQSDRRTQSLAAVIEQDLAEAHTTIGGAVTAIALAMPDDPRFRAGVLGAAGSDRSYVLDYAGRAMRATGLALLQIRNDSGRIVSSGHFPGEFDRIDTLLPSTLGESRGPTLVSTRTAEGDLFALARIDSVTIGGRTFSIIGGRQFDTRFVDRLARSDEIDVALALPDTTIRSHAARSTGSADSVAHRGLVRAIPMQYVDATKAPPAQRAAALVISRSLADVDALRRGVDRWIITAFLLATGGAVLAG
jgi:hypothetical protein